MTTSIPNCPRYTCAVEVSSVHLGTWSSKSLLSRIERKVHLWGFVCLGGGAKTVLTFESSRDVYIQMSSRWLELCLSEFLKLDILSEISICFPLCV